MKPSDLRKLNTRVAYPWPLGDDMPDDVTGMGTDEIIYGASPSNSGVLGEFILGWNELGDEI